MAFEKERKRDGKPAMGPECGHGSLGERDGARERRNLGETNRIGKEKICFFLGEISQSLEDMKKMLQNFQT
jgi:hypothetical protein